MQTKNRIRVLRAERGWSQTDLASRFTKPRQIATIGAWERGNAMPDIETVLEMAQIFGVLTDSIFTLEVPSQ